MWVAFKTSKGSWLFCLPQQNVSPVYISGVLQFTLLYFRYDKWFQRRHTNVTFQELKEYLRYKTYTLKLLINCVLFWRLRLWKLGIQSYNLEIFSIKLPSLYCVKFARQVSKFLYRRHFCNCQNRNNSWVICKQFVIVVDAHTISLLIHHLKPKRF